MIAKYMNITMAQITVKFYFAFQHTDNHNGSASLLLRVLENNSQVQY